MFVCKRWLGVQKNVANLLRQVYTGGMRLTMLAQKKKKIGRGAAVFSSFFFGNAFFLYKTFSVSYFFFSTFEALEVFGSLCFFWHNFTKKNYPKIYTIKNGSSTKSGFALNSKNACGKIFNKNNEILREFFLQKKCGDWHGKACFKKAPRTVNQRHGAERWEGCWLWGGRPAAPASLHLCQPRRHPGCHFFLAFHNYVRMALAPILQSIFP